MKKILNRYEKAIRDNYKAYERYLDKEVAKFYKQYGDKAADEIYKYNRDKKFKEDIREKAYEIYRENNKLIREGLRQAVIEEVRRGKTEVFDYITKHSGKAGKDYYKLKGIRFDVDVTKIVNEDVAGLNWLEREGYNREQTIKKTQETLIGGFDKGLRYEEMAKELQESVGISYNRSRRIIATEYKRCTTATRLKNIEKLSKDGLIVGKKWISSQDERVRSSHAELDGQIVGVNEKFKLRGFEADGPGGFGDPAMDINCRCTVVAVYKGETDDN